MGIFDRIMVGVDGTDFGFEALHQALALSPDEAAIWAVTALDSGIAVHAGFDMSHVAAELEEEAERARAHAAEIVDLRSLGSVSERVAHRAICSCLIVHH